MKTSLPEYYTNGFRDYWLEHLHALGGPRLAQGYMIFGDTKKRYKENHAETTSLGDQAGT